jgi:hypothetical protein
LAHDHNHAAPQHSHRLSYQVRNQVRGSAAIAGQWAHGGINERQRIGAAIA